MSSISREEVLKIAQLAHIELTEEEISIAQKKVERILGHFSELESYQFSEDDKKNIGIEEGLETNEFRKDKAIESGIQEKLLKIAPAWDEGNYFTLPPVLEEK